MTMEPQTLSQRLAEGRLPISDVLRLAVQLGDALRCVHDEGRIHGALTSDVVVIDGSDLKLIPAGSGAAEVPPCTALELFRDQSPDIRSDIFAFGALLYEMITGRCALEGNTQQVLSGSMPAAMGEGLRQRQMKPLDAEVELLESRLASQLEQYEAAINEAHRGLAKELSGLQAVAADALDRSMQAEQAAERALGEVAGLQRAVSEELQILDAKVATQNAAIESNRAGIVRSDELVERVVEAMEVLQGMVIDQGEDRVGPAHS
jgi:hypothetical protein